MTPRGAYFASEALKAVKRGIRPKYQAPLGEHSPQGRHPRTHNRSQIPPQFYDTSTGGGGQTFGIFRNCSGAKTQRRQKIYTHVSDKDIGSIQRVVFV